MNWTLTLGCQTVALLFVLNLAFLPATAFSNGHTSVPETIDPSEYPSDASAVGMGDEMVEEEMVEEAEEPKVQSDPKRAVCAYKWNSYYAEKNMEIQVTARGKKNESIVFFCQSCNSQEHFVDPFLKSEYQGKTGMERIKECGFTKAIFRGRGINEVVVPVE